MAEYRKPFHPNGECTLLRRALGKTLPHRSFLQEFRPQPDMYLRPDAYLGIHGDGHSARVNIWSQILSELLEMRGVFVDPAVVGSFAEHHDLRRADDNHDPGHGSRGAEHFQILHGVVAPDMPDTVPYLISYHVPHDWLAPAMTPSLQVAKDADSLDRVREKGAFNPHFLRLPESRELLIAPAQALFALSTQIEDKYGLEPYDSVMEAAVELGLVRDR